MCHDLQPEFQITSFFSLRSIFVRCICNTEKPCWTKLSDQKSRTLHSGGVGTCKVTPTRIRELLGATRLVGCRVKQEFSNMGISRKSVLFYCLRYDFLFIDLVSKQKIEKRKSCSRLKARDWKKEFPVPFPFKFLNERRKFRKLTPFSFWKYQSSHNNKPHSWEFSRELSQSRFSSRSLKLKTKIAILGRCLKFSAQLVDLFNIRLGRVLEKILGSGLSSGRVRVLEDRAFSGVFFALGFSWVFLGIRAG